MEVVTLRSSSEAETIQQGEQFASQLLHGDVVALEGDLGAGKTEFVKGICRFFAVGDLVTRDLCTDEVSSNSTPQRWNKVRP